MDVFITGGTGLVGSHIVRSLIERGDRVRLLTRSASKARSRFSSDQIQVVEGHPQKPGEWQNAVDGADAVINLAGESIFGKRWTAERKERIRKSRIESTQQVVRAMAEANDPPKVLVSASGVGYYGVDVRQPRGEDDPPGRDFLGEVCREWEHEAEQAGHKVPGAREVRLRLGLVLSQKGGLLQQMLLPFRFGVGGPLGDGSQWMSWVHLDDVVGIFLKSLDDASVTGAHNAVAPTPVTNEQFSRTLASVLGRPCFLRVPGFALRLVLGEMGDLALGGQNVRSDKMRETGYSFRFFDLESALRDLLGERTGSSQTVAPATEPRGS